MLPTLATECSQFLEASKGQPILKYLPSLGQGFRKVKVRQKKCGDLFIRSFNEAFLQERRNLLQRSVITRGMSLPENIHNDTIEPFYVFPRNGFKFMYCQNPSVTTSEYKITLDKLIKSVGDDSGVTVFHEILKYQYEFDNLAHGIKSGGEVIFFNIPYFYAIRKSLVADYEQFFYS